MVDPLVAPAGYLRTRTYSRPLRSMLAAAFAAGLAVALAGCSSDPPAGGVVVVDGATDPGSLTLPPHTPVAGLAIDSCDVLPASGASDVPAADRLPALRLPCLTPGPDIDLASLGGRPLLVNLWANWCGPCREEMPLLQANHVRFGTQVQFLGVNTRDSNTAAAEFLSDVGVTYPQLVDAEGDLLDGLRVPGLPVTVVVDTDGRVAGTHIGPLDQEAIDRLLENVRGE